MKFFALLAITISLNIRSECFADIKSKINSIRDKIGTSENFKHAWIIGAVDIAISPTLGGALSSSTTMTAGYLLYRAQQYERILKIFNETTIQWGPFINQFSLDVDPEASKDEIKQALLTLDLEQLCPQTYDELVDFTKDHLKSIQN